MLTLIYPYRNRDLQRVRKSLDSLTNQTRDSFRVEFVDYGSDSQHAAEIGRLVEDYNFVHYSYHPVRYQPWNKSRALNHVIRRLNSGFCFVADVDMIFHPEFVQTAANLQTNNEAVYFKTGFLTKSETKKEKEFSQYEVDFYSTHEATGLTMFPVTTLHAIRGFDEFYHFWGAEDTDIHIRLRNNGTAIRFFEERTLMLHQWHPSYRSREQEALTQSLQITGIVQLNHRHMAQAKNSGRTSVNPESWGWIQSEQQAQKLDKSEAKSTQVTTRKEDIDELIFCELPGLSEGIHSFRITPDDFKKSLKYKAKKGLGKKVPSYYSMKEVNDKLLLHIISFYRNYPYIYRIGKDGMSIHYSLIKEGENPGKTNS